MVIKKYTSTFHNQYPLINAIALTIYKVQGLVRIPNVSLNLDSTKQIMIKEMSDSPTITTDPSKLNNKLLNKKFKTSQISQPVNKIKPL